MQDSKIIPKLLELHPTLPKTRQFEYSWAIKKIMALKHRNTLRVLDVGCDGSIIDKYLMDKGVDCVCADIDPKAAYYWNGEPRDNFIQVDCRHPPEEWYNSFDHIIIISTLEHLNEDDDVVMVKNLEFCLKIGGKMLITVPFGEGLQMQGRWLVRCYNSHNIGRIVEPARLKVISWTSFPKVGNLPIFCVELGRG